MDDLLDTLVANLKPVRRRTTRSDALPLALLCAAELALFLAMGAMRPDFFAALQGPSIWWKLISFSALALLAMVTALRSFDPAVSPRRGLAGLAAAVGAMVAVGAAVDLWQPHAHGLAQRLHWAHGLSCAGVICVLSLPPLLMLAWLMRRGAPTHARATALAVGAAAAAWGAFMFVFACPHDDPLYVAVWFGGGCAVTLAYARLLLPRLARW